MKRILKWALCLLVVVGVTVAVVSSNKKKDKTNSKQPIMVVDFDESLGKGCNDYSYIFANPEDVKRYEILKGIYETNSLNTVQESSTPKIPKILHQIWVGPKTPPTYFVTFQEKWKTLHPDWEYHLWTDSELEDLNLELKDLIDASPNYAEKSDIIRSELLDRFGGVYLDVDMDPFHALDELHKKYDFYCGIENPHKIATTNNRLWLGISIIASAPNHPILKRWKELIRARWDEVNKNYNSAIERVINHTYFPFSMAFFEKYQEGGLTNMALPTTYFYPLAADHAAKRRASVRAFREMFYDLLIDLGLKRPRPFSRVAPETIAVHYWGNSWLPSQQEQLKDLQHQLDLLRKESYRMQARLRQIEATQNKAAQQAALQPSS
ncbi:MAG: hypothetical protein JSR37_09795 [Verrucomicrobia bacterium]|nr:hypothetical protein [Verrucomicrobiota bacterium]